LRGIYTAFVKTLVALLALAAALPASAADDARTEVSILGGVSLLDAETEDVRTLDIDPFLPPGLPRGLIQPVEVRQRRSLGSSILQGFVLSRRVARRALVEAEWTLAPNHTLRTEGSFRCPVDFCRLLGIAGDEFPIDGRAGAPEDNVVAYHYGLGLAYELTGGEARPFLSAGLGAVTYDLPGGNETSLAVSVGAGVRLHFGEHLGARVEAVDRIVPDHFLSGQTEHDVHVRLGVLLRLP
jgi:hypothetical protein